MRDPEPPITPPEDKTPWPVCPICGERTDKVYKDKNFDIFACENCVKSHLIDELMDIPEDQELPECPFCGEREQSVYSGPDNEIRACWKCLRIEPAE